jgi:hypothetical protein
MKNRTQNTTTNRQNTFGAQNTQVSLHSILSKSKEKKNLQKTKLRERNAWQLSLETDLDVEIRK